jgi:cytochrome c peroxidase
MLVLRSYLLRSTAFLLVGFLSLNTTELHAGPRVGEPLRPLRQEKNLDPDKVALGDSLFHDRRLSADDTVSCASCHNLATNGSDSLSSATGIGGVVGPIKTPTVYNSGYNFVQFWDGRAADLEEQAAGPIHNPIEMGSNWEQVLGKLQQDKKLVKAFEAAYPDGLTPDTIVDAIAIFERSLVTTGSPFDRWLDGDDQAMNERQLKGYRLFKSYGCVSCHQGRNVGGNLYAFMGAMGDYFADRGGEITEADLGRFNVTKDEDDRYFFKVPSLRLAARQAFFFHDASQHTLEDAVRIMGRYQLGRDIPRQDIADMIVFLNSLVGVHPRLKP